MRSDLITDLRECGEFRQTLQARPPRLLHASILLLAALLIAALLWSGLTKADLVVRTGGIVRAVEAGPEGSASPGSVKIASIVTGRVMEAGFREGDEVKKEDVLLRLDAEKLQNEKARRKLQIQSLEEESLRLETLRTLTTERFTAARARAASELHQSKEEVRRAKERQESEVRLAELELREAEEEEKRLQALVEGGATARLDLLKASARLRESKEKLRRARLPVEEERIDVFQRALEVVERDDALQMQELELKVQSKKSEAEAEKLALAGIELELSQTVLKAPMGGVLTQGQVKVGDLIEAGKTVFEIVPKAGLQIEAPVPTAEIGLIQLGMDAKIRLDAYDYQKYGTLDGKVAFISPDSQVRSSPEGGQTVVYTVRIDLLSEEVARGEFRGRVKLGMTGQVDIWTESESLLYLLGKKIRQTISLN